MTRNQIEYLALQENRRHQRVAEAQNEMDIGVRSKSQVEQERHNKATEAQAINELYENVLHNRRTESINEKHYNVVDPELVRHNKVSEGIEAAKAQAAFLNAGAAQSSAAAALQQATTAGQRQIEDARHNRVSEVVSAAQSFNSWLQANAAGRQATASLENAETNAKAQKSQATRNAFMNVESVTKSISNIINSSSSSFENTTRGLKNLVPVVAGLAKVL